METDIGKDIVTAGMVKDLRLDGDNISIEIQLASQESPLQDQLREQIEAALRHAGQQLGEGVGAVEVHFTADTRSANERVREESTPLPNVRKIIAVGAGKGGVGKSTVSANLALALQMSGAKVGLMDADIYGPSMPRMMGITGQPVSNDGKNLEAMENYGLKVMSIGFLVEDDTPMIWRGPMVQSALEQMMRDVNWGELDVLVVDMPPGTGDAQLTMSQKVPLTGAVIVSTPQDIALLDARKGLNMFRKVDVPVFGIVENMSYFTCPRCNERSEIFAHGGARLEAERLGCEFLGEIPLAIDIRTTSDGGSPIVVSQPDSEHAKAYRAISDQVADKIDQTLALQETEAPRIVIQ